MQPDVWSRVVRAIRTGARLPNLVETATFGFDIDTFAHGCEQLLCEPDLIHLLPAATSDVAVLHTQEATRGC